MSNQNFQAPQNVYQQQNPMELLDRYLKLLWSKRYVILIIAIVIAVIWSITSQMIIEKNRKYATTAIIKFDDPRISRSPSAVMDFSIEATAGKVAVLTTRSFLLTVVDSLNLNLRIFTRDINRFEFYKDIQVEDDAPIGRYKFIVSDDSLEVYFASDPDDIQYEKYKTVPFDPNHDVKLDLLGLKLVLDANVLAEAGEVEIINAKKIWTIDRMIKDLEGELDRSGTIFKITFRDKDPEATAKITNTIANLYLDKLLEFKRFRTTSVLKTLEEQLTVARIELDKSEESLKLYRENNPYLLLSNAGSDIVNNLAASESELNSVDASVQQLNHLINQNKSLDFDAKKLVYFEIISFLESRQLPGSRQFAQQYSELLDERSRLLVDGYTPDHPMIKDLEDKINNLQEEILNRANQYLSTLTDSKNNLRSEIYRNRRNIGRLPSGELQLAELQRDQEVKQRIYSSVLVKYNEAKVADAAVIPDAFLIEEAAAPILRTDIWATLIKLSIGPLIGIIVAVSIFVLMDLLDSSARRVDEIESKLKLPVLATIPIIADEREVPDEISLQGQLDSKLITSDYAPSIASEKVRLVRTKISLAGNGNKNALLVASLSPNEGKSLFTSNLGITFAQQKIKTLIIDADLRRGVLHKSFNCSKKPGVADFLARSGEVTYLEFSKVVQQTHVPNLFMVSSGIQVPNPSELLGSDRMRDLLEVLKYEYGMIIIDTPPMEFMPEVLILNSFIHNIVLVVRYGRTNLNKLKHKIDEYSNIRKDFSGVVLNASNESHSKDYHSYSYYHY